VKEKKPSCRANNQRKEVGRGFQEKKIYLFLRGEKKSLRIVGNKVLRNLLNDHPMS